MSSLLLLDWSRLPIIGISTAQALAVHRTGQSVEIEKRSYVADIQRATYPHENWLLRKASLIQVDTVDGTLENKLLA